MLQSHVFLRAIPRFQEDFAGTGMGMQMENKWGRKGRLLFAGAAALLTFGLLGQAVQEAAHTPDMPHSRAVSQSAPAPAAVPVRGAERAAQNLPLQDPFHAQHGERGRPLAMPLAEPAAAAGKEARHKSAAPAAAQQPQLQLKGILTSGGQQRAMLSLGKKQFSLAPGESQRGIRLLEIGAGEVRVETLAGEQTLPLR